LRVEVLTDYPDRVAPGEAVWLEGSDEAHRIASVESGGRATVVYLEGVGTREAAEALAGRYLETPARTLDAGEYYWHDLIGLRVIEPDGAEVGELVEVFRAGANEVYRVVATDGTERLVPALRRSVHDIDLERRVMTVAADDAEEVR
jgi:16S rRNA processing protein RimM